MSTITMSNDLLSDPVFWGMLLVIYLGLTPFVLYVVSVIGANLTGKPVPRFYDLMAMILGQGHAGQAKVLDGIAHTTQDILTRVSEEALHAGRQTPPPDANRAKAEPVAEEADADGSAAWADRRRSNRGAAARGTGYGPANPKAPFEPNVGTRAGDRQMFTDELRSALRRLDLLGENLPDVATLTRAYKDAAKAAHPDQGGSIDAFLEVKSSYDLVLKEISTLRRGSTKR